MDAGMYSTNLWLLWPLPIKAHIEHTFSKLQVSHTKSSSLLVCYLQYCLTFAGESFDWLLLLNGDIYSNYSFFILFTMSKTPIFLGTSSAAPFLMTVSELHYVHINIFLFALTWTKLLIHFSQKVCPHFGITRGIR